MRRFVSIWTRSLRHHSPRTFGSTMLMRAPFKKFNGRRAVASLLGLLAGYAFLDAIMLFVERYPKRLLDPQPEHWWSEFIVAFGLVVTLGFVAAWGALRLWRSRPV